MIFKRNINKRNERKIKNKKLTEKERLTIWELIEGQK